MMIIPDINIPTTSKPILEQSMLDVANKRRTNIFNWKGQFTPDFVSYLIKIYAKDGYTIADPFSGSGTVLIESSRKGYSCIGFEINPSAYFMSCFFKYSTLSYEERNRLYNRISTFITPIAKEIKNSDMVYTENSNYRESYKSLLNLSLKIARNAETEFLPFLINVLFLCEKDKKMRMIDSFRKNFSFIRNEFLFLPPTEGSINIHLSDARNISSLYRNAIDLIITSPPYINVFNYHQNYRGIIECFNYDVLKVAVSEIGSNRKNRSNRFKTVVQYAEDMGQVLFEAMCSLKVNGLMIFVVGRESMVRKTRFYNSKIITDLVASIPSLVVESCDTRSFCNRYGKDIKEDILIIRKCSDSFNICPKQKFKDIGLHHISQAKEYVSDDLQADLQAVLSEQETIIESPIYI